MPTLRKWFWNIPPITSGPSFPVPNPIPPPPQPPNPQPDWPNIPFGD